MIRVRKAAILFAIGSTIYWEIVAGLLSQVNPIAGISDVPFWLAGLINMASAMVYAVITLWFCHWLARRIGKQAGSR